uniref:Armadillo repeat-containing protein 8 n=1 Tax=Alexandrium andersonii TaxID=327968 RepID=A0A7S2MYW6_9DINO
MKDLPLHEELHRLAVAAIRNVAFGNDAYKTVAVRAGGIPVIVTAMMRFPKDAKLQEQAIGALTSICDTVGRAVVCARLGGVEAIIAAMKRHPSGGHVAELGCIILCMFCDDGQMRQHIVRSHALPVAKALSRADQSEVRRWGCELLRNLSDSGHAGAAG